MKKLLAVLGVLLLAAVAHYGWWRYQQAQPWAEWESFAAAFINADGRVVDRTFGERSTSEGQAYGLFFALAANDRARFDFLLRWTRDNLAGGDFSKQLPAWLWGKKTDGSWGVRDTNPASDADLWTAYVLLEAARLWGAPHYRELGQIVLWQVKTREVAEVFGIGPMLIPAPEGFRLPTGNWRLNPSYLPEFQLRYLMQADASGPWRDVWNSHLALLRKAAAAGIAPDWYEVDPQGAVLPDTQTQGVGSYDAIRTYLWAGMTRLPEGRKNIVLALLSDFRGVIARARGVPEFINPQTRASWGGNPLGFSAAVLPYLKALDDDTNTGLQLERLRQNRLNGNLGSPAHYYDQVLALFGEGWAQQRYRFDETGQLIPKWQEQWFDSWRSH